MVGSDLPGHDAGKGEIVVVLSEDKCPGAVGVDVFKTVSREQGDNRTVQSAGEQRTGRHIADEVGMNGLLDEAVQLIGGFIKGDLTGSAGIILIMPKGFPDLKFITAQIDLDHLPRQHDIDALEHAAGTERGADGGEVG